MRTAHRDEPAGVNGTGTVSHNPGPPAPRDTSRPKRNWRSLGASHRRRRDAAASVARQHAELQRSRSATARERWPAIVRAIQTVIADYNEGDGRELLVVKPPDDRQHQSVVIESAAGTTAALVVTLDEAELSVGSRPSVPGAGEITRWITLTRSDEDTAAYVLQDWLERL